MPNADNMPFWLRRLEDVRRELKWTIFPRNPEEGVRQCAALSVAALGLIDDRKSGVAGMHRSAAISRTRCIFARLSRADLPFLSASPTFYGRRSALCADRRLGSCGVGWKRKKRLKGRYYWVVAPEDFILQKLKVGRPRDFEDVLSVLERSGKGLDQGYLEKWSEWLGITAELDYVLGL